MPTVEGHMAGLEPKDFDGDGKQEMVILAALKKHLDVLD